MSDRRKILIADPDLETLRSLKAAFGEEYEVIPAKDGSKALELSVLKYPDLILFYRRCPLIGATQFLRILRANPRTEEVPLIVLSDEPLATENMPPSFLQGVLVKPLNLDEVRSHVAGVLRRAEAARQVGGEDGAVSGGLDQLGVPDLLQIFSVNRRTGCLQLGDGAGTQSAEVFLHEGRIEDAVVGVARGEKAMYRLLTWEGGRFTFIPERRAASATINASTDSLLMEGMRQGDELKRLLPDLPGHSATLERLVPPEGVPDGLHPVTAEIFELAKYYPRVGDLLDRARATDLAVSVALKSLVEAGLLRVVLQETGAGRQALLSADELLELRSRLRRAGLAPSFLSAPKVAVVATEPDEIRRLGAALSRLPQFTAADLERLSRLPVGTLGTLELDTDMSVHLYAVSPDPRLLPLAYGLSAGTVAGLVLGTSHLDRIGPALSLLEIGRRAGLLLVRRPGEPEVDGGGKRVVMNAEALSDDVLRRVLSTLLTQVAGTDLRGVSL